MPTTIKLQQCSQAIITTLPSAFYESAFCCCTIIHSQAWMDGSLCNLKLPLLEGHAIWFICRDGLRLVSETSMKRVTAIKFSNGGSRLAVCAGRNITIFNALTMRIETTLQVLMIHLALALLRFSSSASACEKRHQVCA